MTADSAANVEFIFDCYKLFLNILSTRQWNFRTYGELCTRNLKTRENMKKSVILVVVIIAAVVCWNWLLESRSVFAMIAFFAVLVAGAWNLPVEESK